jgi:two-component sensor histidine kinase
MLAEDLSRKNQQKVNRILEVIIAYAGLDFSKKTRVSASGSVLDAIGAGVNMLGEELQVSTVSLREKEHLLKEVHHRVKNNLQIVSSLLRLQSENVLEQKYLDLITDSRNRINSMAIVHEMLYSSPDLSRIEVGNYIRYLAQSIDQSFSKPSTKVEFEFKITDGIYFDIDRMISIGLIINEVISNSFKYAFPKNTGFIYIAFKASPKSYQLTIKDNGVGLPPQFNIKKDANLGMQLIQMLTEQLEGRVKIVRTLGTSYLITLPK